MARIAVDVDSTLYDFELAARNAFVEMAEETGDRSLLMGAYHPWVEWRSPADACGLDRWLEAIGRVHQPHIIYSREPFPGAVETCRALEDAGHELLYLTAREERCMDATYDWLAKYGFPLSGAHGLVCAFDKSEALAPCQYLIDDRPRTVVDFVYDRDWKWGERRAFVKSYQYNQALTDLPNIYLGPTWTALRYYLERKGVIR